VTISATRQALADAITAAGYRTYTDLTRLSPTCVAVWVPSTVTRVAFRNVRDYVIAVHLIADQGTTKADVDWIDTALTTVVAALEGSHVGEFITVDPASPIEMMELGRVGASPKAYLTCTLTVTVAGA
jgi:hypothetical protein